MDSTYENLGSFYLGKDYDLEKSEIQNSKVLYESKDLMTHGICVGMTGSGKTGLCISLLEEAVLDGIPVIAIDPKGDLGNLLLQFEDLDAKSFKPWVNESEAKQKKIDINELAEKKASLWSKGIVDWDQSAERIHKLKNEADYRIYTPGGDAGLPVSFLGSLASPKGEAPNSTHWNEKLEAQVSSLLSLIESKETEAGQPTHTFLTQILNHYWIESKNIDFAQLIRAVQSPPFKEVGVMLLDDFFNDKQRNTLAMKLNAFYSSPSFKKWTTGQSISDFEKFMFGGSGKPQVSIFNISQLEDSERQFVVSQILTEVLGWTRKQKGTTSLRAVIYMDEIFGFFPPSGNPPSKNIMLTLLKQARAHGVGILLATQNPVDLDYKGLSNTGTWFVGRLQTERDKKRLLDGLKQVSPDVNLKDVLSSLDKRVFLLHNVHEDKPQIFHTRWALSYLAGPLASPQIKSLMEPFKIEEKVTKKVSSQETETKETPTLSEDISTKYIELTGSGEWRALPAQVIEAHFVDKRMDLDEWVEVSAYLDEAETLFLEPDAIVLDEQSGDHLEVPLDWQQEKFHKDLEKSFKLAVYKNYELELFKCDELKMLSEVGETEEAFRGRLAHQLRELRDEKIKKLTETSEKKIDSLTEKIRKAQIKLEKEEVQFAEKRNNTIFTIGADLLNLFGSKRRGSLGNKIGGSLKRASTAYKEKADIAHAEESLEQYEKDLVEFEIEMKSEIETIKSELNPESIEVLKTAVKPRKSDLNVKWSGLFWIDA